MNKPLDGLTGKLMNRKWLYGIMCFKLDEAYKMHKSLIKIHY